MFVAFVVNADELNKFGSQTVDGDSPDNDDGGFAYIAMLLVALALVIFLFIFFLKRRKKQEEEDEEGTTLLVRRTAKLTYLKKRESKTITKEEFSVGRSKIADFRISGISDVSRIHAHILRKGEDFYLKDKESTNGTFLNDRRLLAGEEALLEDGDKIEWLYTCEMGNDL